MQPVDNVVVRHAVGTFAARPEQRTSLDVLRSCMYGELLLDTTGSTAFDAARSAAPGSGPVPAGSELRIAGGRGPDGGRALFAFTSHAEIDRHHPPGTRTQSLVQPAVGVLELARSQGDRWLYIDPAGPTCALSNAEIDFALRNPNNAPLKAALAGSQPDRAAVIRLLRTDGPLLVAADETAPNGPVVRSTTRPDGSHWLLGFTSAPEVIAYHAQDAVAAFSTGEVLAMVRDRGFRGLLLNPAGPWAAFSAEELTAGRV
ncbi:SseB family protein [Mycolicibacillus trivialis]|uniref:SseB protein N-terminal domain-containing protein n=1 Tax=Mycolicibacillus trivialis TaxID=1798 RepID=A0A1X2EP50_9MYCO|nr:SseB family protein [Mycolicibacillus trivialis]ORX07889.1 hypothetical protein AWC30_02915 [Mycolicibacillus trivialis]